MAKILAVDDQLVMRQMVSVVLEKAGHTVTTAEDGVQGLAAARKEHFDLIISDVNMPNMGGISFVGKIKRMEAYQYVPILMLTTESSQYRKDKARQSGASGWLTKPFDPPRLENAVNRLISKTAH
ncbi:response regulator [Saccharobesus litoralis]|uniref:Response regulator n=1 Tax=Saccharobesus litoralis TaxID=2172099 RepID=A0A2S0VVG5_9ALTE|nr:response regulator [Saccharobesus litoralis]AWB68198.1 response regulator [Saccharobesus litoralis]